MDTINHFIEGKKFTDKNSRKGKVFNPATGEQIAEVELASKDIVNMAVESSSKAFVKWSKTTTITRARIFSKYKDLLVQNMSEIAELVSKQHGKTIPDAKGSIQRGIEVVEYVTGITSSFVLKYTSTEDTNIPFASVTSKDSASGSNHCTCSVVLVSNPTVCWKVFVL